MRIELIAVSVLLVACGDLSIPGLTPHKIEIRQGNQITPEMREKLKVGMTRLQVRAALGTPLVNDPFHVNRWDYVYRLEQKGKVVEQQRLTLYFENDRLARIDDSGMPASSVPPAQTLQPVVAEAAPVVAPPPPAAKPEPAPAPKAEPRTEALPAAPAGAEQAGAAVKVWSEAWAARDVAKYLSSYTKEFRPDSGLSHASWEAQRRERIGKAKNIKVELSEVKVAMQGENRANVFFKQSYSADNHKDVVRKIMGLEKVGDKWLIVSELAAKIEAAPPAPAGKPEPAPAVKAKPAAGAPHTAPAGVEQAVDGAVQAWSEAWSARDVAKYLSSYAKEFRPDSGLSHASWEAQRRERIGKAKNIKLELSEVKVAMQGESRANVSFKQSYSADNHKDVVHKVMGLEKVGDKWLIVSEKVAGK